MTRLAFEKSWGPLIDCNYDMFCLSHKYFQLQQIREHLLLTHLVIEPFGIALRRRLSKNHPIYRLLFPHLHTTSAINHEVKFLINGVIDKLFSIGKLWLQIYHGFQICLGAKGAVKLLQQEFKKFDLSEFNFPEQLKKRGVDNPNIVSQRWCITYAALIITWTTFENA